MDQASFQLPGRPGRGTGQLYFRNDGGCLAAFAWGRGPSKGGPPSRDAGGPDIIAEGRGGLEEKARQRGGRRAGSQGGASTLESWKCTHGSRWRGKRHPTPSSPIPPSVRDLHSQGCHGGRSPTFPGSFAHSVRM